MGQMQRVVGGRLGGRRLLALPSKLKGVRPTSSKLRAAVFDRLQAEVVGARVLEPFAGTGAISVEALSRGAAFATLIERQRGMTDFLARQLTALELEGVTRVISGDARKVLQGDPEPFDLVYLDPPYEETALYSVVATHLVEGGWLRKGAVIVVEFYEGGGAQVDFEWPEALEVQARKRYGQHRLDFLRFTGEKESVKGPPS